MRKRIKGLISSVMALAMVVTSGFAGYTPAIAQTAPTANVETVETSVKTAADYGLADEIQDGVILHCFDWKYNDIKAELASIAEAGFTSVQTSPAQPGCGTDIWWGLYQPLGFYIGTNQLGTKEELKALCEAADQYGIKVIVDVVANHLAGDHSNIQNDLKDSQYWHTYGSVSSWADRYQVTTGEIGMPDINSEHPYVQEVVAKYIDELKSVGVDGIRWDAIKHIALPSEGCQFIPKTTSQGLYHYGEILVGPDDSGSAKSEQLMKEYTNYMTVTDSIYGMNLRDAFNNGGVPQSHGNWCARGIGSDKLIYWAESHDTWSNNQDWGFSNGMDQNIIDRGYAIAASRYLATALYFSRPGSTAKDNIKAGQKGSTAFKNKEIAAINHLHNACIGQKDYYVTGNNVAAVCREKGAVVVMGGRGNNSQVSIANGGKTTAPGTYTDEITGNQFTVTESTISGQVGSTGIAVFYDGKPIPKTPTPTISKEGGNFSTDTLSLTIGLKNATSGTYKIGSGSAETYTSSKTITIGSDMSFGDSVTVTLTATDGTTTETKTFTFTKVEMTGNVAYIDLPSGWNSTVYCYAYNDLGNNGKWPGAQMTKVEGNIYSYEVPESIESPLVIFSDGSQQYPAAQQPGLELEGSMIYQGGSWKPYNPNPVTDGKVIVKHVDESGKSLATDETLTGKVGAAYTTAAKTIKGYTLKETPANATGKYTAATITVKYVYEEENNDPKVTSSVVNGTSFTTETQKITLTLSNATSGTYSVDNGPVKSFTGSVDVVIGQGKIGDSAVTVEATAKGDTTKTFTFTFNKKFGGKTVDETKSSAPTDTVKGTTLSSKYSTNAAGSGVKKTITVDGDMGDWDSSMIVAQGTANDDPRVYRPNSMYEVPIDLYTLYAAYDDSNLYLMWEMTNVQDVVAPVDNYPLSQGVLFQTMNVPFFIAIDTRDGATAIGNKGKTTTGTTIWDSGITFENSFNRLIAVSTNGANGPFVYSGDSTGLNAKEIYTAKTSGITFKYGLGILSKSVIGIDKAYGEHNNRVVGDMCNEDAAWVDFNTLGHSSSTMDFHYEMAIPYETLGVSASDVSANGLGVMLVATMGKSGMDCLPYDLSMNDQADLDDAAGSQEFNSFEKSDEDNITAAFASVGKAGSVVIPTKDPVLNFGADRSAPQEAGTTLKLSGVATGGSGSFTYTYYVDDKEIGTGSSVNWTPKAGSYVIKCTATDSEGKSVTSAKYYTVEGTVIPTDPVEATLTVNKASVNVGDTVTMTATATGGTEVYTYRFEVNGDVVAESSSNKATWKATAAGKYTMKVTVTDSDGDSDSSTKTVTVSEVPDEELTVSLKLSASTISPKETVTMTATAAGGSGKGYKYTYKVGNKALTSVITLKSDSTSSKYTWKSSEAGSRKMVVTVTDSNGNTATASKDLTIKKASNLTATIKLSSDTIAPKKSVTITASASGGSGSGYKYKFQVANTALTKFVTLSSGTSKTSAWKASEAGMRYLMVTVTDSQGNSATATKLITVQKESDLAVSLKLSSSSVAAKSSVKMTVVAAGGSGSYTYSYKVANKSLTSIVDLATTTAKTYTWKTSAAGNRLLLVTVTDSEGNTATAQQALTITK